MGGTAATCSLPIRLPSVCLPAPPVRPARSSPGNTPDFIQQPEIKDTVNNVEIQTPYCPLYYPAQWGNALRHEHDDSQEDVYKVHFYGKLEGHEAQLLFSIYFGGDEGEQLGAVMREGDVPVPVNILMAELNLSGWDEADAEQMYSMQESSNEVIEKIPFLP